MSEGLSEKAILSLQRLIDMSSSEARAVAECLEGIASNGGKQATDEHLMVCAEEIIKAAPRFIVDMQIDVRGSE